MHEKHLVILKDIATPLLIFVGGVLATLYIGGKQIQSAEVLGEKQILAAQQAADIESNRSDIKHRANLRLSVTTAVIELINNKDGCEQKNKVSTLIRQIHTEEYNRELWELYNQSCSSTKVAVLSINKSVKEARLQEVNQLIEELNGYNRRLARNRLTTLLNNKEGSDEIYDAFIVAMEKHPQNYRINLGILVALAERDGKWSSKTLLASVNNLKTYPSLYSDTTFRKWLNEALSNNSDLNRYSIQILYSPEKESVDKKVAITIKDHLSKAGLTRISVSSYSDLASSDQIRYWRATELEDAQLLKELLEKTYTDRVFNLQPVKTETPNSLSIILKGK